MRACVRVCNGGGGVGGWVVGELGYVLVCMCILVYLGGGYVIAICVCMHLLRHVRKLWS